MNNRTIYDLIALATANGWHLTTGDMVGQEKRDEKKRDHLAGRISASTAQVTQRTEAVE